MAMMNMFLWTFYFILISMMVLHVCICTFAPYNLGWIGFISSSSDSSSDSDNSGSDSEDESKPNSGKAYLNCLSV